MTFVPKRDLVRTFDHGQAAHQAAVIVAPDDRQGVSRPPGTHPNLNGTHVGAMYRGSRYSEG